MYNPHDYALHRVSPPSTPAFAGQLSLPTMKPGNRFALPRLAVVLTCWLSALLLAVALPRSGAAADVAANTGTVQGQVSHARTGAYVGNARVTVDGTNLETFTNPSGAYRLSGVPVGTVVVRVFYTGESTQDKSIAVSSAQPAQLDFVLGEGGKEIVALSAF